LIDLINSARGGRGDVRFLVKVAKKRIQNAMRASHDYLSRRDIASEVGPTLSSHENGTYAPRGEDGRHASATRWLTAFD
jgi:hypothetical protein